jgi:hypothetical protein
MLDQQYDYVDREAGTIAWPNGADVAPDTLYNEARDLVLPGERIASG